MVNLFTDVGGGASLHLLGGDDIQQMQLNGRGTQVLDVDLHLIRPLEGAYHNGHLGLGGNFQRTAAEMQQELDPERIQVDPETGEVL